MNLENFILKNSKPGEEWKNIPEYEDFYMISTHGRILVKERLVKNSRREYLKPVHFINAQSDKDNRKFVMLCKDSKKKRFYLALLMAKTFIPNPENLKKIRFKDGNYLKCHLTNIEWASKIDTHTKYNSIELLDNEIWKEIPGYEGLYAVSTKGRIKSLDRDILYSNGRVTHYQEKLLSTNKDSKGYLKVHLCDKDKNQKHLFVHRLVALTFIENPNNYPNIDHIDTNPLNNCVENLRWTTQYENMQNELTKLHLSKASKRIHEEKRSWNCKPIVQLKNGILINTYSSIQEAAKINNFNYSCIQKCLSKRQQKHKGFTWMYLSDYQQSTPEGIITAASPIIERSITQSS